MKIIDTTPMPCNYLRKVTFELNGHIITIDCMMGNDGGDRYASPAYTEMFDILNYMDNKWSGDSGDDEEDLRGYNLLNREFNYGHGFTLPFSEEFIEFLTDSLEAILGNKA